MSLLETIKRAGVAAVNADNPVAVLFGNVAQTNPLSVDVHQRLTLTEDFLVVPESLTRYVVTIEGQDVVIRVGLQTGDRVILLRVQGGQRYVVLDKVVT